MPFKNKVVAARAVRKRQNARYRQIKTLLVDMLGGACAVCGYNRCKAALQFHHLRDKQFNLSGNNLLRKPLEVLIVEAKKCNLLCANCHAEHHWVEVRE